MADPIQAVSDLSQGEAALVNYPTYRAKHPLPEGEKSLSPDARIFTLPPEGAALVNYNEYDGFILPRKES